MYVCMYVYMCMCIICSTVYYTLMLAISFMTMILYVYFRYLFLFTANVMYAIPKELTFKYDRYLASDMHACRPIVMI